MRVNVKDFFMSFNENTIKFIRLPTIPKQRMQMNTMPMVVLEHALKAKIKKSVLSGTVWETDPIQKNRSSNFGF